MNRLVDLPRVRAALDVLDRVAERRPDLVSRDPPTVDDLAAWDAFLSADEPSSTLETLLSTSTARFPVWLLERADPLISPLQDNPPPELRLNEGNISRGTVLRLALFRGLQVLEAQHLPPEMAWSSGADLADVGVAVDRELPGVSLRALRVPDTEEEADR